MANLPHMIYILSDEHCGKAMSHMGDPNVRTPNMDRLADEGISFSRAYSNCPVCTPSRGTIFSGRYAHSGPVQGFFDVFKATAPSTATMLRAEGYHTAYFGKWHCGVVHDQKPPGVRENPDAYTRWPMRTPEFHRAGFQDWYGFEVNNAPFKGFYYKEHEVEPRWMEGYQTDVLTDMAIEYITSYYGDEPLFLVLSVEPPHFPLDAPKEFLRFKPDDLIVPPNFGEDESLREQLAVYYAMVENLDWNIGRLMQTIDGTSGFKNNTATAYFSDHGDFMGSHNAINRKSHPQEESVRIPAIFHWPNHIPAQGKQGGLFSLVDLLPTTLGLLGAERPVHLQGYDHSSKLRGSTTDSPDTVLLEMHGNPRWNLDFQDWRGLVTDQWKYAFYETGHQYLFNLASDPYEINNLSEADPEMCAQMRQRLLKLLSDTREPFFHVIIEHGVPPEFPVLDVSDAETAGLSPAWSDMIRRPAR